MRADQGKKLVLGLTIVAWIGTGLWMRSSEVSKNSFIENFEPVRKDFVAKGIKIDNASLQWLPKNLIAITGEDALKTVKVIDVLEDNDDVQNVFHNADIDPSTLG